MTNPKVAIVQTGRLKGNEKFINQKKFVRYEEDVQGIRAAVARAVELTVGSVDNLVKEGQTVLIKANLAFQAPPESFAVVDPRTVEAVVSYFKESSRAREVWIGDNPSLGRHVGRARPAFETAGMEEAARRGGVDRVIYFDETETVEVDIPNGKLVRRQRVFKPFLEADVVINLPKMKVHLAGTVTLGLKNWNGIVPNDHPTVENPDLSYLFSYQQGQHRIDLGQKFADLYKIRAADWTVVDGIIGMEGQGPHMGTPVEMNLIIAGVDTVAVDAVTSYVMGFETNEIPAVRCAHNDGMGEMRMDHIDVVGTGVSEVRRFFKRPNIDPVGMYRGIDVIVQQTCPGCYANVRGALDLFAQSGIELGEFIERCGEVVIVAGGVPDLDPEYARDKNLFVVGDCWKYFPSRPLVETAMQRARRLIVRPGCAPVYIFAQLNGDLVSLAKEAGLGEAVS